MKPIYKTSIAMAMVMMTCLLNMSLKSQTYYSRFSTPVSGTTYSYGIGGVCIGCGISNPSYASTMSITDSSRVYMTVGALNSIAFRLKLTDTANHTAGVVVGNTTGLLNVSLLSAITLKTYYSGTLQETFAGGSVLNLSLLAGSKQKIEAVVSKKFNEVQFEISNVASVLWDINMFYAYGISNFSVPLPVKLVSFKVANLKDNRVGLQWQPSDETGNKGYHIFYSNDGMSYSKLNYMPVSGHAAVNSYEYIHALAPGAAGSHFYYLVSEDLDGQMTRHEVQFVLSGDKNVSCRLFPNPVINILTLDLANPLRMLTLYDYMGKVILSQPGNGRNIEVIDLESYLPGNYLARLEYEDGKAEVMPLVKQ